MSLLDARGVPIDAGDTVIYGFGVGRSVAMAEGVVLGDVSHVRDDLTCPCGPEEPCPDPGPSLTPSGRVRLRVVRRSYASGTKPVVDVAGDRLVVLKKPYGIGRPTLPPSPLPTQDEVHREQVEQAIESYTRGLRATEVPKFWEDDLASYHVWCARQLEKCRKELSGLDAD